MASVDVKPDVVDSVLPREEEEKLDVNSGMANYNVWALKIPRFLMERWEQVNEAGVELGTLVVDNSVNPPKITLRLPLPESEPGPNDVNGQNGANESSGSGERTTKPAGQKRRKLFAENLPDEYDVFVPTERAHNTYIFTEKERKWGPMGGVSGIGKRKREPAHPRLLAKVAHECSAKARENDPKYRNIRLQREVDFGKGRRPIQWIEDQGLSKGQLNQLASGFANINSTFGKGMVYSQTSAKGERNARLERGELLDRIFDLFKEKPYWNISTIKNTLQQPEAWLRENLRNVAEQVKEGTYKDLWRLRPEFQDGKDGAAIVAAAAATGDQEGEGEAKKEEEVSGDEFEVGDDDDDDEDLEEVIRF